MDSGLLGRAPTLGGMPLPDLTDLTREEISKFLVAAGAPRFRGDQVFRWIWRRGARSFDQMTDLPAPLRAQLAETARITFPVAERIDTSADGTRKFLVRLADGLAVESVLIPEERRMTLCISSQVGCALACTFCATGTMGLARHLRAGEIAGQVALAHEELLRTPHEGHPPRERPITNIVYMGMGEPLHNYDNTLRSLQILVDEQGLGYPPRRITVSTVGLVPQMLELGRAIPVTLAISLHAPNDELRAQLMPIDKKWPLAEVIAAARSFPLASRARITFEYVLLAGVNDRPRDAEELAQLLGDLRCKVNLIPFNEHPGAPYARPSDQTVRTFEEILLSRDVMTTVRTTRGRDIAAACGQLALRSPGPVATREDAR